MPIQHSYHGILEFIPTQQTYLFNNHLLRDFKFGP